MDTAAVTLGYFVGTLVPTFLISRLFLWLTRNRRDTVARLLLMHGASFAVCELLAGLGFANGGPFAWEAGLRYFLPQAIWLAVDLVHRAILLRRRAAQP